MQLTVEQKVLRLLLMREKLYGTADVNCIFYVFNVTLHLSKRKIDILPFKIGPFCISWNVLC